MQDAAEELSRDSLLIMGMCAVGRWLEAVTRAAIAYAPDPVELVLGDRSDVPADLGRRGGPPRIVAVSGTGREVLDLIAAGSAAAVVAVDDPVDSVRFEQAFKGWSFLHTLREQTRYAAAFLPLRNRDHVLMVRRGGEPSARSAIAAVIRHLRIPLYEAHLDAVQTRFGGSASRHMTLEDALALMDEHYVPLASLGTLLPDDETVIVREVLSPLVAGSLVHDVGPVVWRRSVFFDSETGTEGLPAVIDTTGMARILFYGPYFHLPPGHYAVSAVVDFSKQLRGETFVLRVVCGTRTMCRLSVQPTDGGAFSFGFGIDHDEPETRLEFQFMNLAGLIDGHISIHHVTWVRSGEAGSGSREPLGRAVTRSIGTESS